MQAVQKSRRVLTALKESVFDVHATDFWLEKFNPMWSVATPKAQIVKKVQVAKDTFSLYLKPNRHVDLGLAGQHHPIRVSIAGRYYERNYSFTTRGGYLVLTVKKVAQGKVSYWLIEEAKVGDYIELGQPFGDMTLRNEQNLVLLAAGSGITPMLSLIEQLERTLKLKSQSVSLLYWVKEQQDAAYLDYFNQLAKQYTRFQFQLYCTAEDSPQARLNVTHLAQTEQLEQSAVFACGPLGFVQTAEALFGHAQLFMSEAFSLQLTKDVEEGVVNLKLTKSDKTIQIAKGQSILEALEAANLKPQHGCRMGICNKCACVKNEGATKNLLNQSENSEPNSTLKICVNSAKSDLIIDL